MSDKTLCKGNNCPMKEQCKRYTSTPNPAAIFACFLFLLGTFILLCVYAMECKTTSFIGRLFKYTPKKDDDKKIKHNEEDKRGWDGC